MQLGLVEDDPTSRATAAASKWSAEFDAELRRDDCVGPGGTTRSQELAVDQLPRDVLGERDDVVVGCLGASELVHGGDCSPDLRRSGRLHDQCSAFITKPMTAPTTKPTFTFASDRSPCDEGTTYEVLFETE